MYKKAISGIVFGIVLFSSCHRDSFYNCWCHSRDSTAAVSLYRIGRTSGDNAYATCRIHNNSTDSCFMEVLK